MLVEDPLVAEVVGELISNTFILLHADYRDFGREVLLHLVTGLTTDLVLGQVDSHLFLLLYVFLLDRGVSESF